MKMPKWIKRALVSRTGKDSTTYPITQVKSLGGAYEVEYLYPYGAHGSLPPNSHGVTFCIDGQAENVAGIYYSAELRPKDLEPGEFACGNFLEKTLAKFLKDGVITIESSTGSSIVFDDAGGITLSDAGGNTAILDGSAAITLTSKGGATALLDANITLTAPTITLAGNVAIGGSITQSAGGGGGGSTLVGDMSVEGTVTATVVATDAGVDLGGSLGLLGQ